MRTMEAIIRSAGKFLSDEYRSARDVSEKQRYDLVTTSDQEVEKFIIREIRSFFPEDGIYAEESGSHHGSSGRRWIIDPVDGTADFVFGVPYFAISAALEAAGGIVEGYVYNPIADEMYTAYRNDGYARLNGAEIHVSATEELSEALIAFGFSANLEAMEQYASEWGDLMVCCRKTLPLITPSLTICNVARGRIDAYIDTGSSIEGKAAAGLILQRAGGEIISYNKEYYAHLETGHICSNGVLRVL